MRHHTRTLERLLAYGALLTLLVFSWTGRGRCSAQGALQGPEREELLATIRDPRLRERDPDRVILAMQRLGVMKDTGAIQDLISLLTFRRLYPEDEDPTLARDVFDSRSSSWRFPAIEALTLIGRPALPALVQAIEASDPDSLESKCALEAVRLIFLHGTTPDNQNPDESAQRFWREAAEYLTQAAGRASSPQAEERLRVAAEKLEHREDYKRPH